MVIRWDIGGGDLFVIFVLVLERRRGGSICFFLLVFEGKVRDRVLMRWGGMHQTCV